MMSFTPTTNHFQATSLPSCLRTAPEAGMVKIEGRNTENFGELRDYLSEISGLLGQLATTAIGQIILA